MACGREPAGVTAIPLGRRLPGASSNLPGRQGLDRTPKYLCAFDAKTFAPSLFGLAPGGVCRAAGVAACAVRSYRTVSPLPRPLPLPPPQAGEGRVEERRSVLCGTFPGLAPAGRYPAPFVHGARTFLPGHLSVSAGAAVRPTDEDRDGDAARRRQGAWAATMRSKARTRAAMLRGRLRCASTSSSVFSVDTSATPSTRCGRK